MILAACRNQLGFECLILSHDMAGWHLDTSPVMNIAMELFTVAMVLMVCRSWMITDDHG